MTATAKAMRGLPLASGGAGMEDMNWRLDGFSERLASCMLYKLGTRGEYDEAVTGLNMQKRGNNTKYHI